MYNIKELFEILCNFLVCRRDKGEMATSNKVSVSEVKKAATTAATTVKKATEELKKDATAVKDTATKTATKDLNYILTITEHGSI